MPNLSNRSKVTEISMVLTKDKMGEIDMTCIAKRNHTISLYANFMLLEDWNLKDFLQDGGDVKNIEIGTDLEFFYVNVLDIPRHK